jgi:uncharacterized protein (DUF697 family)
MHRRNDANDIIKTYVLWSMGGGLIPIPLADLAAVTVLQLNMLERLATLYGVDYSRQRGKTFVAALTGSSAAKIGSSLLKIIPGIGSVVGGVAMSITSGASTYAVGQVAINHFEVAESLDDIDVGEARQAYEEAFEEGKEVAAKMKEDQQHAEQDASSEDVFEALEKLGALRDKGVITEEEFEQQKRKLLERL